MSIRTSYRSALSIRRREFLPPQSNIHSWLRADSAAVADGQQVTSITSRSGPTWTNDGATGPNYIASSIGSKPSLRFNRTNSTRLVTSSMTAINQPITISTVFKLNVKNGIQEVFHYGGLELIPQGDWLVWAGDALNGGSPAANVNYIATLTFDNANTTNSLYINGDLVASRNNGNGGITNPVYLGMHPSFSDRFLDGDISEIIAYNKILSASERADLHTYFFNRYGILSSDVPVTQRTNLIPNPSFENDLTSGVQETFNRGDVVTTSRSTDAVVGAYSYAIVNTVNAGGSDAGFIFGFNLTAGTYTASCWMKTISATNGAFIARQPNNNYATIGNENHINGTNGWTRVSVSFTISADTAIDIVAGLGPYGQGGLGEVRFDGLMLEKSNSVGTYFDGSYSAAGKSVLWSGQAHNSSSREIQ